MSADRKVDPEQIQTLAEATQTLADNVADLARGAGVQMVTLARRSRRQRNMIWALAASVLLDILLSLGTAAAFVIADRNADRIAELTERLNTSQTTTRQQALCPLYTLMKDSYSEAGRKAAPDPEKYDNAYRVIQQGYDALKCAEFISEPQGPPGSTPTP